VLALTLRHSLLTCCSRPTCPRALLLLPYTHTSSSPLRQAALPHLSLPQSSRALVAAVALGHTPPPPWLAAYMPRLAAQLSELASEGLVDVLHALAAAGALPGPEWLERFERDLQRRLVGGGGVWAAAASSCWPDRAWRQHAACTYLTSTVAPTYQRRFGFVGPVELSSSAFLLANLGASPSEAWCAAFLAETLKFRVCAQCRGREGLVCGCASCL
jgi:hypothetical protein